MAKKQTFKDKLKKKPELMKDTKKMMALLIEYLPEGKIEKILDYYACVDNHIVDDMLEMEQYNQDDFDAFVKKLKSKKGFKNKDTDAIIADWFDMLDVQEVCGKSGLSFRILTQSLEELDINNDTKIFLECAGISCLEDLMKLSVEDLIAFQDEANCNSISVAKDLIGLIRKLKGKKEIVESKNDFISEVVNAVSEIEENNDSEAEEDNHDSPIAFPQKFPLALYSPRGDSVIHIDEFELLGFYDEDGLIGIYFTIKGEVTDTFPSWFEAICYDSDGYVIKKINIQMNQAVPGVPYRFKKYIKVDSDTKRIEFEAYKG